MPLEICFPSSPRELIHLLGGSPYLRNLSRQSREQVMKNGFSYPLRELTEHYANATLPVLDSARRYIAGVVARLYKTYPKLPRPRSRRIYFVVIDPASGLEFGTTSFTIQNVVFLHHDCVDNQETIMHECIHVVQRDHATWFDRFAASVGYLRIVDPGVRGSLLMSNPDAETYYKDHRDRIIAYQAPSFSEESDVKLQPVAFDLRKQAIVSLPPMVEILGATLRNDSFSELIAVRLTRPPFVDDADLRGRVNDVLASLKYW